MFSEKDKNNFLEMVSSLKLAQRAELWSGEDNLIKTLYVDPLPDDGILNQVIQDNTVFLIGRKGTGKSTIFSRVQDHFRSSKSEISAYVDVKTVYGKSNLPDSITEKDYNVKLDLYEGFIKEIISDLFKELEENLKQKNRLHRIWVKNDYKNLLQRLNLIQKKISETTFKEVSTVRNVQITKSNGNSNEKGASLEGKASLELAATSLSTGASLKEIKSQTFVQQEEYSSVLIREFNLKEFITDIISALQAYGINKLHIILDDFSEIDKDAQKIFVDTILSPLNNWSNKFIRFKVAGYPNSVFYGDIDKGKIDEIQLDYYNLYPAKDLPELETKALEFLNRLLVTRFRHYLNSDIEKFFIVDKGNDWESTLKLLFHVSMNIPRILGHILNYCHQSAIVYNQKISKRLIEEASQKYYENQVKYYFEKTNYLKEAHDEKLDRLSQQNLLNTLVEKSKTLKASLRADKSLLFKDLPPNKIPTSHFFINKEFENFLYTLELHYFVNKYYEQSDRDGIVSSIYSLNYGLCMEQNIIFGRPEGDTKYRKYYISRHFNNSELIQKFLLEQKKFICSNCGHEYDYSLANTLETIGMLCYDGCVEKGFIKEVNKFNNTEIFEKITTENLLPEVELEILFTLKQNENTKMYASLIAKELDCSHQLISKRTEKLEEADLIEKENEIIDGVPRRIYKLKEKAHAIYFS